VGEEHCVGRCGRLRGDGGIWSSEMSCQIMYVMFCGRECLPCRYVYRKSQVSGCDGYRVGYSYSTIILAKMLAIPNCYLVVFMRQSHLSNAKCYVVRLLPNATSSIVRVRACDARLSCVVRCHVLMCESAPSIFQHVLDQRG
jgi:hypothetical protein